MIFFPNKILKRYTYTKNGKGLYDENILSYEYIDDVQVDFQNETNSETAKDYGVELEDLYKIYFNDLTVIESTDMLEDDRGNRYHIIGGIQEYSHFLNFKKAHLQLERVTNEDRD